MDCCSLLEDRFRSRQCTTSDHQITNFPRLYVGSFVSYELRWLLTDLVTRDMPVVLPSAKCVTIYLVSAYLLRKVRYLTKKDFTQSPAMSFSPFSNGGDGIIAPPRRSHSPHSPKRPGKLRSTSRSKLEKSLGVRSGFSIHALFSFSHLQRHHSKNLPGRPTKSQKVSLTARYTSCQGYIVRILGRPESSFTVCESLRAPWSSQCSKEKPTG